MAEEGTPRPENPGSDATPPTDPAAAAAAGEGAAPKSAPLPPPAVPPAPTLPAMAGKREIPRRTVRVRPSKATELGAVAREMDSAIHLARLCGVAVWVLIALTALRAVGVFPLPLSDVTAETWAAQASSPWPRSVQALLLLLVATQLVMVLLVTEHRINELGARQPWEDLPGWLLKWQPRLSKIPAAAALTVALWMLRLLVIGLVAGAILTDLWRRSWWDVVLLGVFAQLLTWLVVRRTDQTTQGFREGYRAVVVDEEEVKGNDSAADTVGVGGTDGAGGADAATGGADAATGGAAQLAQPFVIGASGGGIRATAFALGGIHAMQDNAAALGIRDGSPEPPLFAVSGGSYLGAALALLRRFSFADPPAQPAPPIGWADSYRPGSVELERLRRHTRYLFEPVTRWRDGLVALVLGATLNVVIVGLVLLIFTWVSATLAVLVGMSKVQRSGVDGPPLDVLWASGWSTRDWLVVLVPSLACLVGILWLTWRDWVVTSAFDDVGPQGAQQHVVELGSKQKRTRERVTVWRQALLALGVAWLVMTAGLPAATKGITWLTTHDKPTATAAGVLNGLGFGVKGTCTQAMVDNLQDAVSRVSDEARISPDEARTVEAGACGRQTTVSRTFATQGDSDTSNDVVPAALDRDAAASLGSASKASLQVGSISALFLAVIGMLSRGPSPESKAEAKLVTRARRWLLTWLPLAIVAGVALYLVLLWMFHYLIELKGPLADTFVAWTAILAALACSLAYLVNANATSMHSFYRSRLADAFCVGRDPDGAFAEQLPASRVYSFSALSDVNVNLNIVTTLNSKAFNEAPTMRGGFPLVFGPRHVTVSRERGRTLQIGTTGFEQFAGAGRTSVMAAVAISGAAISPLMGRFNVQMAPYRLLLTLFNLRVGMWVRNPLHAAEGNWPRKRNGLWLTSKPGLAQIALEAFGRLSADDRWIYLSDGGHLDNTALVECVRHCVRSSSNRVLILDASNDPPDTWSAVGDAIAVIRADLGVDLVRRDPATCAPWARRYAASRPGAPDIEVLVVKSVRVEPLGAGATGTDWNAVLPPNVQSFQLTTKDFPRSSTARQKFGDLEFEAYRGLGYACTHQALVGAAWISPPQDG